MFAITKMALVQPKSNMAGPMEVEDEFAEAGDDDVTNAAPRFVCTKIPYSYFCDVVYLSTHRWHCSHFTMGHTFLV